MVIVSEDEPPHLQLKDINKRSGSYSHAQLYRFLQSVQPEFNALKTKTGASIRRFKRTQGDNVKQLATQVMAYLTREAGIVVNIDQNSTAFTGRKSRLAPKMLKTVLIGAGPLEVGKQIADKYNAVYVSAVDLEHSLDAVVAAKKKTVTDLICDRLSKTDCTNKGYVLSLETASASKVLPQLFERQAVSNRYDIYVCLECIQY